MATNFLTYEEWCDCFCNENETNRKFIDKWCDKFFKELSSYRSANKYEKKKIILTISHAKFKEEIRKMAYGYSLSLLS